MLSGAGQRLVLLLGLKVASATVDDDRWWVCQVIMVIAKLCKIDLLDDPIYRCFASKRKVDAFLILWICRRLLDVYAEELLHISRWFGESSDVFETQRLQGCWVDFESVYPCFSFNFLLKSPWSNTQKAGERYWKAEAASDHWCVSAEWQGVARNGHFPACVHHVWLPEVYRKNLISPS